MDITDTTTTRQQRIPAWLRRAGMAGFLFFLIKGLFWLAAPFLIAWFGMAF